MRPGLRCTIRVSGGAVGALAAWHLVDDRWRSLEAALVARAATLGPGAVDWAGSDQLWVDGPTAPFVVVVGPLCSSAGPALAAITVAATFGRSVAAVRAAALAVLTLFVGNLIRMTAVVVVGMRSGAAHLELAHDGWATWWAVGVTLASTALLAENLRRERVRELRPADPDVEMATSS